MPTICVIVVYTGPWMKTCWQLFAYFVDGLKQAGIDLRLVSDSATLLALHKTDHVMSIDIDWETITTGPEGIELANSVRDFIHDKFQQVQLPRFIRSVHVHSFDFGKEAPVVDLKDISDPLPEFYEDEDDDSDVGEAEVDEHVHTEPEPLKRPPNAQPLANGLAKTAKPNYIDTHLPNLRAGFGHPDQISTPFLSRSNTNTPGIPGGTSNFSYFHLPLSAGLSGTQTPLAAVTPAWHDQHHHPPPSQKQQRHSYADPSSRPSTSGLSHALPTSPTFSPPLDQTVVEKTENRSQDLQITLHISYTGSLSLSLTAEILLDYPMPSFVGIPLKLQITGLSFDGVGLLAYLKQPDKTKVHFCFLGAEDARAMVGDVSGGADGEGVDGPGGERKLGGLLREIRVESEIGRQEGGKQVLKNVGKVEKFVLEQVRRIFEDEFVWPSFWTFLV